MHRNRLALSTKPAADRVRHVAKHIEDELVPMGDSIDAVLAGIAGEFSA